MGCHQRPPSTTPSDLMRPVPDEMLADHIDIVEFACGSRHGRIADAARLKVPSSGRFTAMAAFTVVAAITSLSGIPMQRNFDSVGPDRRPGR